MNTSFCWSHGRCTALGAVLSAIASALPFLAFSAAVAAPSSLDPVQMVAWQPASLVNTQASYPNTTGSTLTKPLAATSAWNANAVSSRRIRGDGYLEFSFGQTNASVMVGLALSDPTQTYTAFNYAIHTTTAGQIQIYEGSTVKFTSSGASYYSPSSVFAIQRSGSTITYYLDGALIYQSTVKSLGSLLAAACIYTHGATVTNCQYFRPTLVEDVRWDVSGATATYTAPESGSTVSGTASAKATSSKVMIGDCALQFEFGQTALKGYIGLVDPYSGNYYGFDTSTSGTPTGQVYVRDNTVPGSAGTPPATTTYTVNDIFRVERNASAVTYYKNDLLIYTSPTPFQAQAVAVTAGGGPTMNFSNCQYAAPTFVEKVQWTGGSSGTLAVNYNGARSSLAWNAAPSLSGATSAKAIVADGFVRFGFGYTNAAVEVGLGAGKYNSANSFQYAVLTASSGNGYSILADGVTYTNSSWTYAPGDIFDIHRFGGASPTIEFCQNGLVVYSHTITNTAALFVNCSLNAALASAVNCEYYGVPEDVQWRENLKTTISYPPAPSSAASAPAGSTLSKTSGTAMALNANAVSTDVLDGDGFVQWTFDTGANTTIFAGLGAANPTPGPSAPALSYAIERDTTGKVQIYENGSAHTYSLTGIAISPGDVFRISRVGTTVTYSKTNASGTLSCVSALASSVNTTSAPAAGDLIVNNVIDVAGASINNVALYRANLDTNGDGIDDRWAIEFFDTLNPSGGVNTPNANGFTDFQDFLLGYNPLNFYTVPVVLNSVVASTFGVPGLYSPPLKVKVTVVSTGAPVVGAPVTFTASAGGAQLSAAGDGTLAASPSVTVNTDSNGIAQAYCLEPNANNQTTNVAASSAPAVPITALATTSHQLLGFWRFDESSGTTVIDSAPGGGLGATLTGNYSRVQSFSTLNSAADPLKICPEGNAVQFDGATTYMTCGALSTVQSFFAWILPDPTLNLSSSELPTSPIFTIPNSLRFGLQAGTSRGLYLIGTSGSTTITVNPATDCTGALTDGNPHLVGFIITPLSGNTFGAQIYLDGLPVNTQATFVAQTIPPVNFVGYDSTTSAHFKGLLDDVRMLGDALGSSEVMELFDRDNRGIPDWWAYKYFGALGQTASGDPDYDGLTNAQEYEYRTNPLVPDGDNSSSLQVVSGDDQYGDVNGNLPASLTVKLLTTGRQPLPNVPVTFSLAIGAGWINGGTAPVIVNTAADGTASVSYRLPAPSGMVQAVKAAVSSVGAVYFHEAGFAAKAYAGGRHSFAVRPNPIDGQSTVAYAWGANESGQLGETFVATGNSAAPLFNLEWFAFSAGGSQSSAAAYSSASSSRIALEPCSEGGQDVTGISHGSWTAYTGVNLTGVTTFYARVASFGLGGNIAVCLDNYWSAPVGVCAVPYTGGWQNLPANNNAAWQTVSCSLSGVSGSHTLYLVYTGPESGSYMEVHSPQILAPKVQPIGFSPNWYNFNSVVLGNNYSLLEGPATIGAGSYSNALLFVGQNDAGLGGTFFRTPVTGGITYNDFNALASDVFGLDPSADSGTDGANILAAGTSLGAPAGKSFAAAVTSSATVKTWGDNTVGQLGLGQFGPMPDTSRPQNVTAVANAIVTAGGNGYTAAPNVIFSGGGGTGAAASATIYGQVAGITLANNGSGYTSAPTVSLSGGGGSGATAVATLTGVIHGSTLTSGGSGYTSAPTVAFSGGGGSGAAAVATVSGVINSATLTANGSGYTSAPTVSFSGGGGGSGAAAVATLTSVITGGIITASGSGYLSAPTISFSGGGGTGLAAYATVISGQVTQVNFTSFGSGYTSAPTAVFTGGGGNGGAAMTVTITNVVGNVNFSSVGSGYTSAPTVSFVGGGGSGAAMTVTIAKEVVGVNFSSVGSGYTSAPMVSFSGGGGSGAAMTVTISNVVASINLTSAGSGYTSAPTVSFSGGGGSGAAATAPIISAVVGITISSGGHGYTSAPTISFSGGGGGSGAAATAVLVDGAGWDDLPRTIPGFQNATAVALGADHTVILANDGTVWASGGNECGQLGIGSSTNQLGLQRVGALSDIVAIGAGNGYTIALDASGHVWFTGFLKGMFGISTPRILSSNSLVGIAASPAGFAAIDGSGNLFVGGLYDPNLVPVAFPTQLTYHPPPATGSTNFLAGISWVASSVTVGGGHMLAVNQNPGNPQETLYWSWGSNSNGQLGDASTRDSYFSGSTSGWKPVLVNFHYKDSTGDGFPDIEKEILGLDPTLYAPFSPNGDGLTEKQDIMLGLSTSPSAPSPFTGVPPDVTQPTIPPSSTAPVITLVGPAGATPIP